MAQHKTYYSKLVLLKKRLYKPIIIPPALSVHIDNFFNNLHNTLIQSKDITRDIIIHSKDVLRDNIIQTKDILRDTVIQTKDLTRDKIIQSKDITRDAILHSKDLTRDTLIQSKDVLRDNIIQTKDILRDTVIQTKDLTRDKIIQSKDITRDAILHSKDLTRDTLIQSKDIVKTNTSKLRKNFIKNIIAVIYNTIHLAKYNITEKSDKEAVGYIQKIIANSKNVRDRVYRYYGRDSVVIYPPIANHSIPKTIETKNGIANFWLSVNRITPEKRVSMQIEAFRERPEDTLVIVGGFDSNSSSLASEIFNNKPNNVHYLGSVDEDQLSLLYSGCTGFITTSVDEDFGMTAVEAMSFGKPVIAPNDGGYRETIQNGETGILIENIDSKKLTLAIDEIKENISKSADFYKTKCMNKAEEFSENIFIEQIKDEIKSHSYTSIEKQLVFIVGIPRSGTTWLWGLLTSHNEIDAIVKSDFKTNIVGDPNSIETNMLFDRTTDEIMNIVRDKIKRVVIEKTPDHLLKINRIISDFPQAKIIHIIRNPMSVFSSYKHSNWNQSITNVQEWLPEYSRRIKEFERNKNLKNIYTISYEDLIHNPKKVLRRVFSFIGVSPTNLNRIIQENTNSSKATGKHSIRKANAWSWKYELSLTEMDAILKGLKNIKSIHKYLRIPLWLKIYKKYFEHNNIQKKQLVFIVGIPRSGTTWLWRLLSEHRDIDVITRNDFNHNKTSTNILKESNMLYDFTIQRIKNVISNKEKNIVVEKTPLHILKLDMIRKEFPKAKIIHVIRHPLSVYASYKYTEFAEWNHTGIKLKDWVKLYKKIFNSYKNKISSDDTLTISYEELLSNTSKTLKRVYDFIGLHDYNIAETISDNSYEKRFPKISMERRPNSLKNKVTKEEVVYIESELKDELQIINKLIK